jgi:transcriptional regulator with XRE-family HTH domain
MSRKKIAKFGERLGISQRLKELRVGAGLSQGEVARAVGLKYPSTIQAYESGRIPKPERLDRLATFFNVYSSWLITGNGPPRGPRADRATGEPAAPGFVVSEKPEDYGGPKRLKLVRAVKRLAVVADDDVIDALLKNVEQFGRIPKKEE